ncbi:unnamed protein product [marine sediment metagenome]|uniref:HTH luxR-type domain-containing protein n=1 Tax=marine sediment metagenome TaxID=412755 RepID=X1RG94_9ZZZZ
MYRPLTVRQEEVLKLIAEGYGTGEIASKLDLSVNTIKVFRAGILNYFGAVTMVQAVVEAFKRGVLKVEDGRISV